MSRRKRSKGVWSTYGLSIPTAFVAGLMVGWTVLYVGGASPSVIPIASGLIGLIVAFGVPLWKAAYVNRPNLAIEISSIRRTISDSAAISAQDDPELQILMGGRGEDMLRLPLPVLHSLEIQRARGGGETLDTLDQRVETLKQRLRDLPKIIEDQSKDLERVRAYTVETITKYDVDTLNRPLFPEVEYDPADLGGVIQGLNRAYQRQLEATEKELADLQVKLPSAERKLDILKRELTNNRSLFTVSVSLINSGRSNTAIKVPALLRVLIGQGNYIDIKLALKDFENKSEVPASGTRIAMFESQEISSLPEEDRTLINTYWGQSVRAWLLVEDIHGQVVKSNYIAFAEGLYQKIIYDRLANAAASATS